MKQCTYCGKEYDDAVIECAIDGASLVPISASPQPIIKPTHQLPALWNPNAAACWSLIFSPAFGAFLHARNAEVLGRMDEAKANRVWFYVSIAYFVFVLLTAFVTFIPEGVFRLAGLGLLLGWYFSLGKKQIVYVKETWQQEYERKSWKWPLLIAFSCLIGAFVAFVAIAILWQLVFGSD